MNKYVEQCIGQVIVSCQAPKEVPFHGAEYMKLMAASVIQGGAKAIRACWPDDIKAIRELGDFPIVGINKIFDDSKPRYEQIFITPTFESAAAIIEAGCDIVALDCQIREFRGKDELYNLIKKIKEVYPDVPLMADCATLEEMVFAAETGMIDIVSSTLSGSVKKMDGPDLEILVEAKKRVKVPINAEGRINDVNDLIAVLETGVEMVTIGRAITMPQYSAHRFINCYEEFKKKQKTS